MPMFEDQTPEVILERMLSHMETDFQTREGSYAYDQAAPIAFELWRVLMTLDELIEAFYVTEHSGGYLDAHAALLALARKQGTRAEAEVVFFGKDGVVVPAGTVFFTGAGLEFHLVEEVRLSDGGGTGVLRAAQVGERYNVDAGEVTQLLRNISSLEGWKNAAAEGGSDPEGDAALYARIDERRKRPATSGNVAHYREWALSVDGVGAVRVDPVWAGPGTVRVLIVGYDLKPVDEAVISACAQYIETQRPVGADVTVESAQAVSVDVAARVVIKPATTLNAVKTAFAALLEDYLKVLSFREYTVYANLIGALLMSIDGVVDYSGLTINGVEENLVIGTETVPVLGEVALM